MIRRLFAALMLGMLVSVPSLAPVIAQTDSDLNRGRAGAAQTAQEIFDLAANENFNAMYDLLHPDSQAVVPRAAVVGTLQAIYANAQAARAQIVQVEILPTWTWGVTGQSYENAAQVVFVIPIVDPSSNQGQWVEDTLTMVQTGGEWRWFFGSTPETVEQAIADFGDTETTGVSGSLTEGDFIVNVVNDLDAFWADVVSYTPFTYESPGVVIVSEGDTAMSACGAAQTGFWGFYCPIDATIYLDDALLQQLIGDGFDFAAAFVIGHEWAHHIQTGVGFDRTSAPDDWNELYSIELELMADCMTGAWTRDLDTRDMLEESDVDEAMHFTIEMLGDPFLIGEYDEQAHGTAEQRVSAFMGGYDEGFLSCNIKI